jgi:hypothetical protein
MQDGISQRFVVYEIFNERRNITALRLQKINAKNREITPATQVCMQIGGGF